MSIIKEWYDAQKKLKIYKEIEANLRREIVGKLVEPYEMVKGVVRNEDIIHGYKLKGEQKLSYKLDVDILREIWADLSKEEKECIKTKPVLWESGYKKLPKNSRLHEAVISKLAMPTLSASRIED